MASKIIVDQLEKTGGTLTALTLPSVNATAGQYMQNDGSGGLSWVAAPTDTTGFTQASQWRLGVDLSVGTSDQYFYQNFEKPAASEFPGSIGSDMAINATTSATLSGAWTFPVTGTWYVEFFYSQLGVGSHSTTYNTKLWFTNDNGSGWVKVTESTESGHHDSWSRGSTSYIFNINDKTTDKVRVSGSCSGTTVTVGGDADANKTGWTFFRIGDAS